MKFAILIASILLLTNCAQLASSRVTIEHKAAEFYDGKVWLSCWSTPVGEILRRYNTPAKMKAYNAYCKASVEKGVLTPR